MSGGGVLRVLSVTQLYPGAATTGDGVFIHQRLKALPEALAVRVWRVRPWFPIVRTADRPSTEMVEGIPVEDVPFLYVPGMLKGLDGPGLLRALRKRPTGDVDVIDAHFAYPTGWAAVRLGKERGLPVVVTMRGTELPYSQDPTRRERLKEALAGADRIIAVSSSLAELARELGADGEKVTVVGNGIDPDRFGLPTPEQRAAARQRLDVSADATVLLTVGGLTRRKGVQRVIPEFAGLVHDRSMSKASSLLYLVAGGGSAEGDDLATLRAIARSHDVEDRVRFLGRVEHRDLPDVYHAADAFVLATSNEGWANALHESIATGLPTVTTDVGGNREVLGHGAVGTVVPLDDADALRRAIRAALEEPSDRAAIAAFGGSRTWAAVGEETAAVLRSAAGEGVTA